MLDIGPRDIFDRDSVREVDVLLGVEELRLVFGLLALQVFLGEDLDLTEVTDEIARLRVGRDDLAWVDIETVVADYLWWDEERRHDEEVWLADGEKVCRGGGLEVEDDVLRDGESGRIERILVKEVVDVSLVSVGLGVGEDLAGLERREDICRGDGDIDTIDTREREEKEVRKRREKENRGRETHFKTLGLVTQ